LTECVELVLGKFAIRIPKENLTCHSERSEESLLVDEKSKKDSSLRSE
jgi:hypothetical protein